jgi:hypothetical protein
VAEIDADALAGSWTHVREEDSGDLIVFRPSASDLPPARGRTSLELVAGGELRHRGPGADDRTVSRAGSWLLEGRSLALRVDDRPAQRYDVESVDTQRLVLRRRRAESPLNVKEDDHGRN